MKICRFNAILGGRQPASRALGLPSGNLTVFLNSDKIRTMKRFAFQNLDLLR